MLTGQELLAKVQELGEAPKTELATAYGYVSKKKDGSDRVNFTAFYDALLNAKVSTLVQVVVARQRRSEVVLHSEGAGQRQPSDG